MDFFADGPTTHSWEKVTRKIVDPITFSCSVNVTFVPRIEDASYETTCEALCSPRIYKTEMAPEMEEESSSGLVDTTWMPMDFSTGTPVHSPQKKASSSSSSSSSGSKQKGSSSKSKKSGGSKGGGSGGASLGAFFKKDVVRKVEDMDNQSLSSKSMNSRSVADISFSERSRSEVELSKKSKDKKGKKGKDSKSKKSKRGSSKDGGSKEAMRSIDEISVTDFSVDEQGQKKPKGLLGNFLEENSVSDEVDILEFEEQSAMSASTLGSKSFTARSTVEMSRADKKLKEKKVSSILKGTPDNDKKHEEIKMKTADIPEDGSLTLEDAVEKKLRFTEGHDQQEIPWPTDSMYDDLFYTSEELADFRYEAFLEEAGLDVNEFM